MRALIAFDLDGVIYTSEPFLGEAYREAIANVNARRPGSFARVPSTREILDHVGWPVAAIMERLFPGIDRTAVDLLYAETLAVICAHVGRREGMLFPGVDETLWELQRSGFLLAIASIGRQPYIEAVLNAHDIRRHFIELITVGGDAIKGKADVLRAYLAQQAVPRAQLVMVGDRASDVEAATALGCRFIGCDYGHGYRAEIEGAGPLVSAFDQLPGTIGAMLAAAASALPNGNPGR